MAEPQDTSRVAGSLDIEPGYRLAARGRPEAEDDRLFQWTRLIGITPGTTARGMGGEWLASRGYDPTFGRKLPVLFEHCGLENIRHEATAEVVRGGSSWARWWQQTLEAIRTWEQADDGLTEAQEEEYKALTAPWTDPSFWFLNALLHACWGQRPSHEPTPSRG
jgi:hypothetical protein